MYTRKDLILLHKYKDETFKKALVDKVVCQVKAAVFEAAMNGEVIVRVAVRWCASRKEAEGFQAQEQQIRELLQDVFPDSQVQVDMNSVSFVLFEFCELVCKVIWG